MKSLGLTEELLGELGVRFEANANEAAAIQQAMGHASLRTPQGYIHWARDARHKVAEAAAGPALAGMAAASGAAPADVVPLPGKGRR